MTNKKLIDLSEQNCMRRQQTRTQINVRQSRTFFFSQNLKMNLLNQSLSPNFANNVSILCKSITSQYSNIQAYEDESFHLDLRCHFVQGMVYDKAWYIDIINEQSLCHGVLPLILFKHFMIWRPIALLYR